MSSLLKKHQSLLTTSLAVALLAFFADASSARNPKLTVTVGQSITHKVAQKVKTVSIANSDVADVVVAGPKEVLLNGKAIGLTTLVIWDENNTSTIFDVVVRGPFSDQQIELRVQLSEVNRTKATEIGADFLFSDKNSSQWTGGTFGGSVATPQVPLAIFDGRLVEGAQGILRYISGGTEIQGMISALVTNGVLRVLAEPNVVAASGQEARFLSGGEIPIPIASSGATGGSTVTIEWKEFGVNVSFVPTIVDSGVINLFVAPEVSDLDFANGIEISGFKIPALRTRKAETTVELKDGETLVIGGLLIEEEEEIRERIPLLGHIPILGYLFSDTKKMKITNELVLVVSPHIVHALPPGVKVDLPTNRDE
ncbi:MAG: pilus assembly protein N-terminal domain-containing protein [Candidatus Krumholzibacteria bacterium]|nr:pilus assembly protein N-terminal domain-containing protein [Candidatus Krumholzibacteria bacterium]